MSGGVMAGAGPGNEVLSPRRPENAETVSAAPAAVVEPGADSLSPAERLEQLCDPGSLDVIRSTVLSSRLGGRARPGDGVVAGLGRVDDRPVACFAQDVGFLGGSLGEAHADTIGRVLGIAARSRLPVVGLIESGGARMQEGIAALCGYGRIFSRNVELTGVVPQISVIGGLAAGGACYSPALTDFVVMTEEAAMFLTGPAVVKEVMGEEIDVASLGGHRVHERNGVCDFVVADHRGAADHVRDLLGYFPQHAGLTPPRLPAIDPALPDPGECVPSSPRSVYDVRDAVAGIVDAGSLLEVAPRWARSIMTGFARLEGQSVGVVASQPRYMGGVLDSESAQKGARFVETCDRFGIPLIVLVDTPGFVPGLQQEEAGVIRFGACLVRAFAAATVPRLTVVLRKAFGGAYIAMNSRDLGADLVYAWPQAEIGVMSAHSAIGIINRRELAATTDPAAEREVLAAAYAKEHLSAEAAAAGGFVDEVIEPRETRARLAGAIEAMRRQRV